MVVPCRSRKWINAKNQQNAGEPALNPLTSPFPARRTAQETVAGVSLAGTWMAARTLLAALPKPRWLETSPATHLADRCAILRSWRTGRARRSAGILAL
jgi:hypothetical protein